MKMKTSVLFTILLMTQVCVKGQNLPSPTPNLQTLAAGSYVIAMDNTLQVNSSGDFNLKSYGLIVHLLNNGVKLKWSIKAGKAKDAADFTAMAEQFQPSLIAGGVSRNFKAGPFVIYAADTTGVAALINSFYTLNGITGNNRPRVYRLTASASNVDIRYDMTGFIPKVAVLNDGKNTSIHLDYMTNCAIPASNYTTSNGIGLLTRCFTFASEPHNTESHDSTIHAIRRFVVNGGNFLAQCAAIESYENNVYGHFHTDNGINVTNSGVNTASTIYPNADLSFSQFEGVFNIKQSGSVNNWTASNGSAFINNSHGHASNITTSPIGASVAKLTAGSVPGGLVFYLGNHSYSLLTDIEEINGIRMYMNAMLTPNSININCTTGEMREFPLPVKLISFTGNRLGKTISLEWKVAENDITEKFELESSIDGTNFTNKAIIRGSERPGVEVYNYRETMIGEKVYYRLLMIDKNNIKTYSNILAFQYATQAETDIIKIIGNPVTDKLTFGFDAKENKIRHFQIVDVTGRILVSKPVNSNIGYNIISIPIPAGLAKGMYLITLKEDITILSSQFIKQ
jgi:hypothetical protein